MALPILAEARYSPGRLDVIDSDTLAFIRAPPVLLSLSPWGSLWTEWIDLCDPSVDAAEVAQLEGILAEVAG